MWTQGLDEAKRIAQNQENWFITVRSLSMKKSLKNSHGRVLRGPWNMELSHANIVTLLVTSNYTMTLSHPRF
jgi:hypothetical protein